MTQLKEEAFWDAFAQYLRNFHAGMSSDIDPVNTSMRGGFLVWSRASEGTLYFTGEEHLEYRDMLQASCKILAPGGDISETAMDSALKTAIFLRWRLIRNAS